MRAGRVVVTLAVALAAIQVQARAPDGSTLEVVAPEAAGVGAGLPPRVMLAGRLVSVDARAGHITIYRDHQVLRLELGRAALVTQGGKDVALADLQPGQAVVVQLRVDGRTARATWVAARPMAEAPAPAVAEAPAAPASRPPALASVQASR